MVFNIDDYQKCFLSIKSSYNTEDWSNDAENWALHHRNTYPFSILIYFSNGILNCNMSQDLLDFDQLNAALSNKMALPRSASKTKYQCSKSNLYPFLVILTNQIKLQVLWIILWTLVNLFSHQSLILEPSWVINLVTHLHRQFSVDLVVEFTVYFLPWTPICNKSKNE